MNVKALIFALSLTATMSASAQGTAGIDRANMNLSVKPGNDFYEYAIGGWRKAHPLDAEHARNGSFTDLDEMNQKRILELIQEYSSKPQAQGTLGQKIGSLYNLAMDSVRRNREGAAPIQPVLKKIADIQNRRDYQLVTSQLDARGISCMMFGMGVGADQKDAANNLVGIGQGGLGLGERDYYLSDDAQVKGVRDAYVKFLTTILTLAGNDAATAQKKAEATMRIETRIAKSSYSQVQLRDVQANYHKITYNQLVNDYPGIDWGNLFLAQGFPPFSHIDVGQPEPIHEVEKILAEESLDDLKAYAEAHAVSSAAGKLDDKFRAAEFEFGSVLSGAQQDRPRWKRATALVSNVLGEPIGKLYVEKYFPESSKQHMVRLVKNLQTALAQRIDEATWMSPATKEQAKDKLSNFIVKVGYPDTWRDFSGLQIDEKLSLFENMCNVAEFLSHDYINRKVNKPVDKAEWQMTPQTVNAYYNPTTNEICFPAAILQPPFFDPNADDAVNYGGIGGVIGHEMSHGFDDQGSQFDKYGNQNDWWTAADKKNFEARTKVLVDFFSSIEALPGKKINGKLTLGENIGDNGGLNIAFRALQNDLKANPALNKTIDGFTPEQRFFLSWATVWAGNARPEFVDRQIKTDPHSPAEARVNAALPQIDAWYKAFNVKKGDKLFLDKKKRANIW
ncbi:M13 family metallopeptidase [Prevotella sp.]|uniref:M13 family metallopeptidase n=1 Tax=Prevotella sp. TaxID=59823 RepID=UPI0025CDDCDA|nr:M13 family metallopeptidase [Prevotella sp.]